MKPATANLAKRWVLPRPIIKSHADEKCRGPGLEDLPKISEFPFNISATAGFVKGHHKITLRKKWAWPWARGAP